MAPLPTGTVTFLFTDIEGSTRMWSADPDSMPSCLERHDRLLRREIEKRDGYVFGTAGDSVAAAFSVPTDALRAAGAAQRQLQGQDWPEGCRPRVRMAVHAGSADEREGDYFGPVPNRCARLMAAAHGEQVLVSGAVARLVADQLPAELTLRDLGVHLLADLARPSHAYQLVADGLREEFPPLRTLDVARHNLPIQVSTFVGRESELAALRNRIGSERVLTLVGVGGAGKTRLALHLAATLTDRFPDGVWWADLAPLTDPSLVPVTVARAIGLQPDPGADPRDALLRHLDRFPRALLLLDNCEHLLAACAELVHRLVTSGRHVVVLATSREALGVAGETVWPVPPLSAPTIGPGGVTDAEAPQTGAVRLFMDRAAHADPRFLGTPAVVPRIAEICARLDGIPLAIELAAARVRALSVCEIADRLGDRFRLLSVGSGSRLPRHQTMRAAIDWSHDLLAPAERTLFRRLAVFQGGWTLTQAESVCDGDGLASSDVLGALCRLVDKSLVVADCGGDAARYRMLSTIRQYASERLAEAGEKRATEARHCRAFLRSSRQGSGDAATQGRWLARMEVDHDNLRAALDRARGHGDGAKGLALAAALWPFWYIRGHWQEGLRRLNELLALPGLPSDASRAEALDGRAVFLWAQGDCSSARVDLEASLSMRRAQGDRKGEAATLNRLGLVARDAGDRAAARRAFERALDTSRDLQDDRDVARALNHLGLLAHQEGDRGDARRHLEESLALHRRIGDRRGIAAALNNLGRLAFEEGELAAARALYDESLAIKQDLGDLVGTAHTLNNLGQVSRDQGDLAAATRYFDSSLARARELDDPRVMAVALANIGEIHARRGQTDAARRALVLSLEQSALATDGGAAAQALVALAGIDVRSGRTPRAAAFLGAAEGAVGAAGVDGLVGHEAARRLRERCRRDLGDGAYAASLKRWRRRALTEAAAFAREELAPGDGPASAGAAPTRRAPAGPPDA